MTIMKNVISQLIDDFHERKLPELVTRNKQFSETKGKADVVIDTGLLNAMTFRNSYNYGQLLETMVFMHLRRGGYDAEYVNTKDGREADFFTRHRISGETQLIQVCWEMSDKKTFGRELQGLKSAMDELSLSTGTIVTWDDETSIEKQIKVIPIWKWLLEK